MIVGLGERFGRFPSEVEEEDAELIQLVKIVELGGGGRADGQ